MGCLHGERPGRLLGGFTVEDDSPRPYRSDRSLPALSDLAIGADHFAAHISPGRGRTSCDRRSKPERQVLPVFAIDKNAPRPLVDQSAVVRIAHVVSHSPGYTLGPVVMTFPAFAWGDSAPTWIYGGGDLWLYPQPLEDIARRRRDAHEVDTARVVRQVPNPVAAYFMDRRNPRGIVLPSRPAGRPSAAGAQTVGIFSLLYRLLRPTEQRRPRRLRLVRRHRRWRSLAPSDAAPCL